MSKKLFFLILTIIFVIKNVLLVDTEECDTANINSCLGKPQCNFSIDDTTFNEFRKVEECKFQIFMDKIQQIDCLVTDAFQGCDEEDKKESCRELMIENRELVYLHKFEIQVNCSCRENVHITNTEQYIECWNKLWDSSIKNATNKIKELEELESEKEIQECTEYGKTHESRCGNILKIEDF